MRGQINKSQPIGQKSQTKGLGSDIFLFWCCKFKSPGLFCREYEEYDYTYENTVDIL